VLRIHVLRPGGHSYYVDDLVPGRAEVTGLAGEAPGRWSGRAAADVLLSGTVHGDDLARLLAGRHPGSGRPLRAERPRSTAGFDLTFSAPKSVSLLHLLGPGEMASEVGGGHVAAVDEAVGYLERVGAGVRRSRGGEQVRLDATGLVAGAFVHRTSRTLDPHLHTHVVVANIALGVDGTWSSLDSRRLFRHAAATRALYHARLRHELTRRLGVAWDLRPSGMGDVIGVDPTLCRLFSGRTADMEEHLSRRGVQRALRSGETGAGARGIAALVTRQAKDRSQSVEELVEGWRTRAVEFGYPPSELTRVVGLGRTEVSGRARDGHGDLVDAGRHQMGLDSDRLCARLGELDRSSRSLGRKEVVAEVAAACPAGAPAAYVERVASWLEDATPADPARSSATDPSAEPVPSRWRASQLAETLTGIQPTTTWTLGDEPARSPIEVTRVRDLGSQRAPPVPPRALGSARDLDRAPDHPVRGRELPDLGR